VRELAQLDATFERDLEPTEEARTEYASRRAALKARLALAMGSPTK
jgi:hypothetical protein